MIARWYRSYE